MAGHRKTCATSLHLDNLRIADGSIVPRVTTGNTMAPCVIIGEKAAEFLKEKPAL
jgi:choline dehydrogenase